MMCLFVCQTPLHSTPLQTHTRWHITLTTAGTHTCTVVDNYTHTQTPLLFNQPPYPPKTQQGLEEMRKFSQALYPTVREETFFAPCGVADLIATCYGGRNRLVAMEYTRLKQVGLVLAGKFLCGFGGTSFCMVLAGKYVGGNRVRGNGPNEASRGLWECVMWVCVVTVLSWAFMSAILCSPSSCASHTHTHNLQTPRCCVFAYLFQTLHHTTQAVWCCALVC